MAIKKKVPAKAEVTKEVPAKAKVVAKATKGKEFSKQNDAVRLAESKASSTDNLVKRISKRLGATQPQSLMILRAVLASIQETVIVKGALNLDGFAKFENVAKPASQGTIQFGDKKGEQWTKPEHNGIKISNINGFWNQIANDEAELISVDALEEVWTVTADEVADDEVADEEADAEEETEEETEEVEAPVKTAPVKTAPVKKAPVKKAKK